MEDSQIKKPSNIPDMVSAYNAAMESIKEAEKILNEASKNLKITFAENKSYTDNFSCAPQYRENFRDVENRIKIQVWRSILDHLELHKIASSKKMSEIEKGFDDPKKVPDITIENVLSITQGLIESSHDYAMELVQEAYSYVMKGNLSSNKHKTNEKYARKCLGKKIILSRALEVWNSYRVSEYSENGLLAIDKVFHALDGAGMPGGYRSPLVDAINTTKFKDEGGETEYFKFKVYHNGNLHIEFKRMDLVNKFNQLAGNGTMLVD